MNSYKEYSSNLTNVLVQDPNGVWHAKNITNNGIMNEKNRLDRLLLLNKELLNITLNKNVHLPWWDFEDGNFKHKVDKSDEVLCICGKPISNFLILHDVNHLHKICIGNECFLSFEENESGRENLKAK